jgi:hypothetical protein
MTFPPTSSPFGVLLFLIMALFLKSVPHPWFAKIYAKELNPKGK